MTFDDQTVIAWCQWAKQMNAIDSEQMLNDLAYPLERKKLSTNAE